MQEKIKLLHLTASLAVGGAEQFVLGLADKIDHSRFETHIYYLGATRDNSLQPEFERLNLPLIVSGSWKPYKPAVITGVIRYIKRHQIDLIHTHLVNADVVGRLVGRLLGIPVVSTLQNEPLSYRRMSFSQRSLERFTARHLATYLVAVSHHLRQKFIQEWGIPAGRIGAVHNAVAVDRFLDIPPGVESPDDGPVITNIASLSPQKAQDRLLDAAKIILQQRPEARFKIVGKGRLEPKLKAYAESLGIADRVTFTGVRYDIPAILAQSDIFTLSSLWEGLPLAAVEAMAAARPVVLTDVGGNRELVESGQNGLLVPPDNVPALAEALLALLNEPSRRAALGQAARASVRHNFSIQTIVKKYEIIYESLLNPARVAPVPSGLSLGEGR